MALNEIEQKTFCVFGARRTGTNYIETLLLNNLNSPVANMNKVNNHSDNDYRPHLFEEKGSKHLIDDVDFDAKFGASPRYNILFVARSPVDWLDARIRYHLDILGRSEEMLNDDTFKKWIRREYVKLYQAALDIVDSGRSDVMICRYEDALSDLDAFMKKIADHFGYEDRAWTDIKRIVAPGGGISGKSHSDHVKSRRVSDRAVLRSQIETHCPGHLIDRLGYGADLQQT